MKSLSCKDMQYLADMQSTVPWGLHTSSELLGVRPQAKVGGVELGPKLKWGGVELGPQAKVGRGCCWLESGQMVPRSLIQKFAYCEESGFSLRYSGLPLSIYSILDSFLENVNQSRGSCLHVVYSWKQCMVWQLKATQPPERRQTESDVGAAAGFPA